ncbi:MAG: hypothetical protein ACYC2G_01960 [Gemmatimonadaceae bacterium]
MSILRPTINRRPAGPSSMAATAAIATVAALLALAALPDRAAAQEPARVLTATGLPCSHDSCVLRVEDGWLSRKLVRGPEGTVVARLGFGGPSLASIVQISDSAVAHARSYQRAQTVGSTLATLGSVASIAATIVLNQQDRDVRDEALAVNIGGLAIWVVGNTFLYKARREMNRSVWWYNRAVMDGR